MKKELTGHIDLLVDRYPVLAPCRQDIADAFSALEECFLRGGKLIIAGNGGSSSDAEHIVGELMKGFKRSRRCDDAFAEKLRTVDAVRGEKLAVMLQGGLPAIALDCRNGLISAYVNDVDCAGQLIYAQQVNGYGCEGDVFLGISTSGCSDNILYATVVAHAKGMKVIGLTGADGGELAKVSDVVIRVPESETYMIQELHLPVYHCLCLMLEDRFFGE